MSKPSAFRIISSLTTREQNRLADYLQSTYVKAHKALSPLLKAWRGLKGKPLDRELLFKKAQPGKKYNQRDWYLLVSRLQNATEDYLANERLRNDADTRDLLSMQALRGLQLPVFFERTFRAAQKRREKSTRFESASLLWEYQAEMEYYDFIASPKRGERTNLQVATDKLDHYYMAEKLRHACLAHSRKLVNQEEYNIHNLDHILTDLNNRPELFQVPAIVVYATCYQAVVSGGEEEDFRRLRLVIEHYRTHFPMHEIRDVYLLAINYCIRAMNQGRTAFVAETQALYQESLSGGYLLEDGQLPESTFTNIVALGLKLEHYEGVADFIRQYEGVLPGPVRESVVNFNLARLLHAQDHYDDALRVLALVETKAPYLYLGAKSLQVRIFVETEEWDAFDSLLNQLRVYLQRHPELGYRGDAYRLFLSYCRKYRRLKPGDRAGRTTLISEIQAGPNFAEREWLLKVLNA